MSRFSKVLLVLAMGAILSAGITSCSRSTCPAYDGLSTNEYNKQKKTKKPKSSGLYGKKRR